MLVLSLLLPPAFSANHSLNERSWPSWKRLAVQTASQPLERRPCAFFFFFEVEEEEDEEEKERVSVGFRYYLSLGILSPPTGALSSDWRAVAG